MAFVTLAEYEQINGGRRRVNQWGLGQTPVPSCFIAMPTNTSADEAQRRWLAMTEEQRQALRAPIIAQLKASAIVVTDDQAKLRAEQQAVNDILAQVSRERANPRLCTDIIRSLFYSTLGSQLSESLFTPDAVARIKQSALANGVPADQIETLYAQAKAALGTLPQATPQQAVAQATDAIMTAAGVSAVIPLSYTRDRIFAIRDEAYRRGVSSDPSTLNRLVREEITKRLGIYDQNPGGDLEELVVRIAGPQAPAPVVYQQPAPAPVYQQPAPVYAPQEQAPPPPATPSRSRRKSQQKQGGGRAEGRSQQPKWLVPVAAAAGGALLILLAVNATKS